MRSNRAASRPTQRPAHPAFQNMYGAAPVSGRSVPRPAPIGRLRHRSLSPLGKRVSVAAALAATATIVAGSTAVAALNRPASIPRPPALASGSMAGPHTAPAAPHSAPARSTSVSSSVVHKPQPAATATIAPTTPSVPPSAAGLKVPVLGLVDRHHAPTAAYAPAVRSFVVDTTWASIQPVQGGPIAHPNAIDSAITLARTNGMALKLRVAAGIDAPTWAKNLDGAPITFYYTPATVAHAGEVAGTVGHFWTAKYAAAYADLQAKLAAAYDDVPQVRSTTVTQCGTIFNETYLRNTKDARNAAALLHGGFTRAGDDACHASQIQAHKVWTKTLSEVAFNPYQAIQPDGTTKQDLTYTLAQMDYCRQVLGANCLLSNFSLSSSRITDSQYGVMYKHMLGLGAPYAFQTATAAKIGSYTTVLAWAASVGASSVELPTGYTSWPVATLSSYAAKMKG